MNTDTYILLRDLPFLKAGTRYIPYMDGYSFVPDQVGMKHERFAIHMDWIITNREWFSPEIKKPSLGIIPEWLHKEQRLKYLQEAMSRYLSEKKEIPSEWIEEEMILNQWLIVRSWKIKCRKYPNYTEDDLRKAFEAGERCELRNDPKNFEDYLKSITT